MTRSSWNILLHRTQIDNLIHSHFTSQRLSYMYKTVNWSFRVLRCHSLSHKKHISWFSSSPKVRDKQLPILSYSLPIPRKSGIQIRLRQEHVREQGIVCVCVGEREREREKWRIQGCYHCFFVLGFWVFATRSNRHSTL